MIAGAQYELLVVVHCELKVHVHVFHPPMVTSLLHPYMQFFHWKSFSTCTFTYVHVDNSDSHHGNDPDGTGELKMTLPSLPQHSEHRIKLSLFIPSMESTSFSGSLEDVAKSHDQTDQSQLYTWKPYTQYTQNKHNYS